MGIGTIAGRTASFLGRYVVRFGRVNPWVTAGLTGAVVGGAVYKSRRDEKRIAEIAGETFRAEIRERDLWSDVRSQVAGASEDLYKTFQVYRKGEVKPIMHRAHACKPRNGEFVVPVDEPDVVQADDLIGRAIENLARSEVNDIPMYKEKGADLTRELTKGLKRIKARLEKAKAGKVKKPDYAGMQKTLHGFLEDVIKPVLSDLSHVIDQGTLRIRAEVRNGEHR
jgi:hypothetical protein